MALRIIWNNIIDEPTDVIVTPASRKPRIGTGLDRIIHEAAGEGLIAARKKLGTIEPGVVQVTRSFGLAKTKCHAKYVIHALGPLCEKDRINGTERPILFGCYLQILCKAVALKAKTVSIPVLSSGKFGMPMPMAVDIAVGAIESFLEAVPELNVKLVGIDRDLYTYARQKYALISVSRFTEQAERAYRDKHVRTLGWDRLSVEEGFASDEESEYFRNIRLAHDVAGKSPRQILRGLWNVHRIKERERLAKRGISVRAARENCEAVLTRGELARATGIGDRRLKRLFSPSEGVVPTRDEIVVLACFFKLSLEYLKAFWRSCNYSTEGDELEGRDCGILEQYAKHPLRTDIDAWLLSRKRPLLLRSK